MAMPDRRLHQEAPDCHEGRKPMATRNNYRGHRIDYVTGEEFCAEHSAVIKHMKNGLER